MWPYPGLSDYGLRPNSTYTEGCTVGITPTMGCANVLSFSRVLGRNLIFQNKQ